MCDGRKRWAPTKFAVAEVIEVITIIVVRCAGSNIIRDENAVVHYRRLWLVPDYRHYYFFFFVYCCLPRHSWVPFDAPTRWEKRSMKRQLTWRRIQKKLNEVWRCALCEWKTLSFARNAEAIRDLHSYAIYPRHNRLCAVGTVCVVHAAIMEWPSQQSASRIA